MTVSAGEMDNKRDGLIVIRPVDNSHSQGLKLVDETQHQMAKLFPLSTKL